MAPHGNVMDSKDGQLLQLFEELVPADGWGEPEAGGRSAQIYSLAVVVELMLAQRLSPHGSLREVVRELADGRLNRRLPNSKRVQEGRISSAPGGYARACARVSPEAIGQVCDRVLEDLAGRIEPEAGLERPVLLLDGTSLQVGPQPGLAEAFPPGHNQHGRGHWGVVRLVGLHDVRTGIALRPAWGPMYGAAAVSEQALAERLLERAPQGSVILGDGNFGVFSCAYAAVRRRHAPLFRLSKQRAQSLSQGRLEPGRVLPVCWRMSVPERKKHPELPAEAAIAGRLLAVPLKGFRPLYLFTTLEGAAEELAALYARRWQMELDLRALKRSLYLYRLRGKSRAAVEKEILTAVIGYGLVRACMAAAARRAGLPPRRLSFTDCCGWLNLMAGRLCSDNAAQRETAFDLLLQRMAQAKLSLCTQPRTYPRAVWGSGATYPKRHDRPSSM